MVVVYFLIETFFCPQWNIETEELAAQEIKLSNLDRFEARWRFENESRDNAGYYASSYSSWLNYGTGLITNIIENLQVRLKILFGKFLQKNIDLFSSKSKMSTYATKTATAFQKKLSLLVSQWNLYRPKVVILIGFPVSPNGTVRECPTNWSRCKNSPCTGWKWNILKPLQIYHFLNWLWV